MSPYTYEYPRPMVTVDCLITYLSSTGEQWFLLIRRGKEPFREMWALPGGFVDMNEDLPEAAQRELHEETGLLISNLIQFATYGKPGRDPRGRTISVVFWASVTEKLTVTGGDDASEAKWFLSSELPALAFDHNIIILDFLNSF